MRFEGSRLACAGLVMLFVPAAAAQTVPGQTDRPDDQALAASLASLKALVNDRNFGKVGFQDPGEAASAVFGDPIRRYIVRLDKLLGFQARTDPATVLEDTRQWIYPVLANGIVRCAVTIAWRPPGGWKAISFGDQGLARVLFATRREAAADLKPPREDLFFLVDVLSANRKFVARRTDGGPPEKLPGQQTLTFTWLGNPPGPNQKIQSAESALLYLSAEAKSHKGPGPGR